MTICDQAQEQLAEQGSTVMEHDERLRNHARDCPSCQAFLENLKRLEKAFDALPSRAAPPGLLARTRQAVARTRRYDPRPATPPPRRSQRRWAAALGGMAALWAVVSLLPYLAAPLALKSASLSVLMTETAQQEIFSYRNKNAPASPQQPATEAQASDRLAQNMPLPAEPLSETDGFTVGGGFADRDGWFESGKSGQKPKAGDERLSSDDATVGSDADPIHRQRAQARLSGVLQPSSEPADGKAERFFTESERAVDAPETQTRLAEQNFPASADNEPSSRLHGQRGPAQAPEPPRGSQPRAVLADKETETHEAGAQTAGRAGGLARLEAKQSPAFANERERRSSSTAADEESVSEQLSRANLESAPARAKSALKAAPAPVTGSGGAGEKSSVTQGSLAQRFLQQRESLTGLAFQPATGYWANTYIPGSPVLRQLDAQLSYWNRAPLRSLASVDPALERTAAQYRQPFDPPQNAALALYLHADQAALDGSGPERLRLQVGLKGALRQGGRRPAMNIGVLLDLRSAERAAGPRIRALLNALLDAKQAGDRFSLAVAGEGGGLLLGPEQFRYGPMTVAMQKLFSPSPQGRSRPVSLQQALTLASESVRQGDDESAPLGSSLVLLVAASPPDAELAAVERLVHANAVAGINLSAVTVGQPVAPAALQSLVLAGQGHLRSLPSADGAAQLVDKELYASSRAVARALRLRIRLAPGVKLVDIIGSRRLDEPQAQRVREQERSIDRRLARNLGIQADRGEDEEGIQIVIPHFYAGDEHVILLDVVAERAGPLADVTVRYKDLVYLRNGDVSAQLALPSGAKPPGPLEFNVLKNHLALWLAQSIQQAGRQLAADQSQQAIDRLAAAYELLRGLQQEIVAWRNDQELRRDERLLADYLTVLRSGFAGDARQRQGLTASLQVAAHRKLFGADIFADEKDYP